MTRAEFTYKLSSFSHQIAKRFSGDESLKILNKFKNNKILS
jgi:hypothetical protein